MISFIYINLYMHMYSARCSEYWKVYELAEYGCNKLWHFVFCFNYDFPNSLPWKWRYEASDDY